jgi:hypothetical protein
MAYVPSRVGSELLRRTANRKSIFYVLFGVVTGLVFLPMCATVPFFVFPFPNDPSYFARCFEFAIPMTIAGALGGYAFWHWTRRAAANGELDADQFS